MILKTFGQLTFGHAGRAENIHFPNIFFMTDGWAKIKLGESFIMRIDQWERTGDDGVAIIRVKLDISFDRYDVWLRVVFMRFN